MSQVRDMMLRRGTKFKVGTKVRFNSKGKASTVPAKTYKVGSHIKLKTR